MSVVNKMLQDLEARKAQPQTGADYQAPSQARKLSIPVFIALGLLVVAVIVWLLYLPAKQVLQAPIVVADTAPVVAVEPQTQTQQGSANQREPVADIELVSEPQAAPEQAAEPAMTDLAALSFNQSAVQPSTVSANPAVNQTSPTEPTDSAPATAQTPAEVVAPPAVLLPQVNAPSQQLSKTRSGTEADSTAQIAPQPNSAATTLQVKSSNQADTEASLKQQVQVALKRGDDDTAVSLLQRLLVVAPTNMNARKRLAAMLFAQGKHDQADQHLSQGILMQPDSHELRLMQARLYVQLNNPGKAHDLIRDYPVNVMQAPDFVSFRAALAQKLARFEAARQDYQQLTRTQPANAKWWLGLGIAQERLGNLNQALQAYRTVRQLSQLSVEVETFINQRIQYLTSVK